MQCKSAFDERARLCLWNEMQCVPLTFLRTFTERRQTSVLDQTLDSRAEVVKRL